MKERNIQNLIMLVLSEAGCVVYRNNCGSHKTEDGRYIKYGVGNPGGSDIIGYTSDGRFLAVEVKTPTGRARKEQIAFINQINRSHGIAFIARSPEEALELLHSGMSNINKE